MESSQQRVVVAITGASGVIYGIHTLRVLREIRSVEVHLVVSNAGSTTIAHEIGLAAKEVHQLADVLHRPGDIGAELASGSFETAGMIVAPCSIKTLSAISNCYASDLVSRAADVTLKEGRPLVLMVRETPLHPGHLRLMLRAAEAGAVIAPPVPGFYHHPETIGDIVDHTVRRALRRLGLKQAGATEWKGLRPGAGPTSGPATSESAGRQGTTRAGTEVR